MKAAPALLQKTPSTPEKEKRNMSVGAIMGPTVPVGVWPFMTDPPDPHALPINLGVEAADSSFALLLRAKAGDADAINRLCARYLPRIRRWAHGRLPASSRGLLDTDDLAQDVLFHAVEKVNTFEPRHEGAFQAYVRQMLLNRVRDEVRRGRRRPAGNTLEDEHPASDPSPLEIAIGHEALERYEGALSRLKPHERELIIAKIELHFSAAEIAEALGKPSAAAAQMAVSRALVRLAQEMAHGR
jgi:RNA polymerase sigma-70 factor (ECF subfamily)